MSERHSELYYPRKCSATNRIITANDHASVQINIGHLDANGVYTSEFTPLAFSGFIRSAGGSDAALCRIGAEHGLIKDVFAGFPKEHKHRGH